MKQEFKNVLKLLSIVCITFLLSNCSNDGLSENQEINQSTKVEDAKKWFENSNQDLQALEFTKSIDWDNAIEATNEEKKRTIEVPLKLIDNTTTNVIEDKDYKTYMSLLFVEDKKEVFKVFDIVYTTKDEAFNSNNKDFNLYKIGSNYSGYITIQDSKNKIIYSGEYQKGKQLALHNYNPSVNATERLVCKYYVTVGPYTNCSNWSWEPDGIGGVGIPIGPLGPMGPIPVPGGTNGTISPSSITNKDQLLEAINSTNPWGYNMTIKQTPNQNTYTTSIQIDVLPWAGIQVFVTETRSGMFYSVQNVVSNMVGLTVGINWTQTNYSQITSGGATYVTLNGVWSYNLYTEGIGTVYSAPFTYKITVHNITGKITEGKRI